MQSTTYRVRRTEYQVQSTTYRVRRTEYNVRRTEYHVQCTAYRVRLLVLGTRRLLIRCGETGLIINWEGEEYTWGNDCNGKAIPLDNNVLNIDSCT